MPATSAQPATLPLDTNPRVSGVPAQFARISSNTEHHRVNGNTDEMNIGVDHIQGIALNQSGSFLFLTHNRDGDYGTLIVCEFDDKNRKIVQKVQLPNKGFNHPGGVQQIGDILVVPLEKDTASRVVFYDLTSVTTSKPPTLLTAVIASDSHKAGGVGITSWTAPGDVTPRHLVAIYDNGDLYLQQSNGQPLASTGVVFNAVGSKQTLGRSDYSTVSLVTDTSGAVYLVGFWTEQDGAVYKTDYMDLLQLNPATWQFSVVQSKQHVICKHGATVGSYGVHFRWAGGLRIVSSSSIQALACARNFVGGPSGATEMNLIKEK
ncbi:hypothetical protein LBMAG53_15620 [Planctomycetota bacterium]|nr:hypothetical protein LBMAG53_15620 [Planctomycetota bacterium]